MNKVPVAARRRVAQPERYARPNRAHRLCWAFCVWTSMMALSLTADAATPEVARLISQFQNEPVFWRQSEIGEDIVKVARLGDLTALRPWLSHKDRRVRGNVAYLFAKLGDKRGLQALLGILSDYSTDRAVNPETISILTSGDAKSTEEAFAEYKHSPGAIQGQIRSDRYYAVHLLGMLRDPRSVDVLIPLLDHDEVNYKVVWALGVIGDARAIAPLIVELNNSDPFLRVYAINALADLQAVEALPNLEGLFGDTAVTRYNDQVIVGTEARNAAMRIRASSAGRE